MTADGDMSRPLRSRPGVSMITAVKCHITGAGRLTSRRHGPGVWRETQQTVRLSGPEQLAGAGQSDSRPGDRHLRRRVAEVQRHEQPTSSRRDTS